MEIGTHYQEEFEYKVLRRGTILSGTNNPFYILMDGDGYIRTTDIIYFSDGPGVIYLFPKEPGTYRSVVGTIFYVEGSFRPYLAMDTKIISLHLDSPTKRHS